MLIAIQTRRDRFGTLIPSRLQRIKNASADPSTDLGQNRFSHLLFATGKAIVEAGSLQARGFGELAKASPFVALASKDIRESIDDRVIHYTSRSGCMVNILYYTERSV